MEIRRVRLAEAEQACGVVVVIDVIRAFTVAAYALAGGARCLWLVQEADEARRLRERQPEARLIGEIGGRLIPGFDHNNSPARMATAAVRDRLLIQRTGAGTRGAVSASGAIHLLACALVNARATATYAGRLADSTGLPVTLLPTFFREPEGIEDDVCADYLEALLCAPEDASGVLDAGLRRLRASGRLKLFSPGDPDFPAEDIPAFLAVDRFSFAMVGRRNDRDGVTYVEVVREDLGQLRAGA